MSFKFSCFPIFLSEVSAICQSWILSICPYFKVKDLYDLKRRQSTSVLILVVRQTSTPDDKLADSNLSPWLCTQPSVVHIPITKKDTAENDSFFFSEKQFYTDCLKYSILRFHARKTTLKYTTQQTSKFYLDQETRSQLGNAAFNILVKQLLGLI